MLPVADAMVSVEVFGGGLAQYAEGEPPVKDKEGYWTGKMPAHNVHPPW